MFPLNSPEPEPEPEELSGLYKTIRINIKKRDFFLMGSREQTYISPTKKHEVKQFGYKLKFVSAEDRIKDKIDKAASTSPTNKTPDIRKQEERNLIPRRTALKNNI